MNWFLIPIYNEYTNLSELIRKLSAIMEAHDKILFIDDGSSDETQAFFLKLKNHQISYERLSQNSGPGAAFNWGFKKIIQENKDPNAIVFTLEGDNTARLADILVMQSLIMEGNDLVLASVYHPNGGFQKTNFWRKLLSYTANFIAKNSLGLKQQTLTSFYRAYHISLLHKIYLKYAEFCIEKGFICKVELLLKSKACQAKIIEVPTILESLNRKGKSKMKLLKTALNYFKFIVSWKIRNMQKT